MQISWTVTASDIAAVKVLIAAQTPHVDRRLKSNVWDQHSLVDQRTFWRALVAGLVTSVQRSGAGGRVAQFLKLDPFPLDYDRLTSESVQREARDAMKSAGLRFTNKIPKQLEENYRSLADGRWLEILDVCSKLSEGHSDKERRHLEREAARSLMFLNGVGQKQSRNILQTLGLTRYEIPIDSRVCKWLLSIEMPLRFGPGALSDPGAYELVLDAIQYLCEQADIPPCALDAAIFASYETAGTLPEEVLT
jgi:hypothetical protein